MTLLLDGQRPDDVDTAARILAGGGLVAFPTETVYGLGADGLDGDAVQRAFNAKGRPSDNPVILHVASLDDALPLWEATDAEILRARRAAEAFWPGPLTLVLDARPHVPSIVTAGLPSVAVRVPDHPVALALIARVGRPLAAPSANVSGRPSPTTAAHVMRTLAGRIDAVLDGGPTRVGVESTVLDLRGDVPRILRQGDIGIDALAPVLGAVLPFTGDERAAPSPGLRHRHYAPAIAEVRLVDENGVRAAWSGEDALLVRAATARALTERLGERVGPVEVLDDEPKEYARGLYAALYRLEDTGASRLFIEAIPDEPVWTVVRDRVRRAAGG